MTDKELLELAAKAYQNAGGTIHEFTSELWNPLEDDGDALRLAVKFNLNVAFDSLSDGAIVQVSISWDNDKFESGYFWMEWLGKDASAATRRAIVRAAAERGKDQL